jgi:hypothetical protein
MPSFPTQGKTTPRVHFNPTVQIFRVLNNRFDLSAREIRSVWYNDNNLDDIQASNLETVAIMSVGKVWYDSDTHCSRGLHTTKESCQRQLVTANSQIEVFGEQGFQIDAGIHDDELIADVYFKASCQSQLEARRRGKQDEIDCQNNLQQRRPNLKKPENHFYSAKSSTARPRSGIMYVA